MEDDPGGEACPLPPIVVFTEDEGGRSVPDADVTAIAASDGEAKIRVRASSAGRAVLAVGAEGPWAIRATAGERFGRTYGAVPGQQVTVEVQPTRRVRVRVLDEERNPIEGVFVRVLRGNEIVEAGTTDPRGETDELRVPDDSPLQALVEGRTIERTMVDVPDPLPSTWTVVVPQSGFAVSGRVQTADGVMVAGARVWDPERTWRATTTGPEGRFSLGRYPDGARLLVVAMREDWRISVEPVRIDGVDADVTLTLHQGDPLTVRVLDEHDLPVEGARVTALQMTGYGRGDGTPPVMIRCSRKGITDTTGTCELHGIRSRRIDLRVDHPAHNRSSAPLPLAWEEPNAVTVHLTERSDWRWRIRSGDSPAADLVDLEGWDVTATSYVETQDVEEYPSGHWSGRTDRIGEALLLQIPRGTYSLLVRSPGGHFSENLSVVVDGGVEEYRLPEAVVALANPPEDPVSLDGEGFRSEFFRTEPGGPLFALSRPGRVQLEVGGRNVSLEVSGGPGVSWLDGSIEDGDR